MVINNERDDRDLLVRIDERTQVIQSSLNNYVTQAEFSPIKKAVYGIVAGLIISFIGAIVGLAFSGNLTGV